MTKLVLFSCIVVATLLAAAPHNVNSKEEEKKEEQHACRANEMIETYEIKKGGLTFEFTNYGAVMISGFVPDKDGKSDDIVLGFDAPDDYKNDTVYFGAIVGRVANRIGKAQFTLDGNYYQMANNDGKNILHGGYRGYGDVIWELESHKEDSHVVFKYKSYDGEEGFPGELEVKVTYEFLKENELGVTMTARPKTKPTPVNLACHTYWNLAGHDSGDILKHKLQLLASKITPTDDELIPTGELKEVKGTPYDFLEPQEIGSRINELPKGYDINYAVDEIEGKKMKKVAVVEDPKTGRKMEIESNQPGVQLYTSGMLSDVKGKGGALYKKHAGIALETQGYPDSVNHPNFPSQIVKPGEKYEHKMVFRFSAGQTK